MKRNDIYLFVTASLAVIVPAPGRFAYGLVLVLMLNLLMLLGTLFRSLLKRMLVEDLQPVLVPLFLMTLAIICKQLLILYSPLMALVLSFVLYMPAVSSLLIGALYEREKLPLAVSLGENMKESLLFSLYALAVFLFRDICGYGTVTLPSASGLRIIPVLSGDSSSVALGTFWASIPGAFVLTALMVVVFAHVQKRLDIVRTSREGSDGQ